MIIVILESKLVLINICNKMPLFGFFSGTNYVIQKRNSAKDGVGVGTYSAIVVLLAVSSFWSPHEL